MSDPTIVTQQLRMFRGDTPTFQLTVLNRDLNPFDLTGYSIWFTAKRNLDDSDINALFQISTITGHIIVTDAVGGIAQIIPPASATYSLTSDAQVFFDIQIRNAGLTRTYTVARGHLSIVRDVTRV